MKTLNARYSKILLILLGVLVAIIIGFQSNAVGFNSNSQNEDQESAEERTSIFEPSGKLHLQLISLLK